MTALPDPKSQESVSLSYEYEDYKYLMTCLEILTWNFWNQTNYKTSNLLTKLSSNY